MAQPLITGLGRSIVDAADEQVDFNQQVFHGKKILLILPFVCLFQLLIRISIYSGDFSGLRIGRRRYSCVRFASRNVFLTQARWMVITFSQAICARGYSETHFLKLIVTGSDTPHQNRGAVSHYISYYISLFTKLRYTAKLLIRLKAAVGIEPTNKGFAVQKRHYR
jgi:hypothetical protein